MANAIPNMSRLVHLDMKGAPPKLSYLKKIFPLLKTWGASGILVEYEDTFPYWDDLAEVTAAHAYSFEEINQLNALADEYCLEVVPLIQTFGHLEFILKHDQFSGLREIEKYPTILCPTNPASLQMMGQAIDQMLQLHSNITHFHIGADEVCHIGMCDRCKERMKREKLTHEHIFIEHIKHIVTHIRHTRPGLVVIAWDDMFRSLSPNILCESEIAAYIEPMVWHYQTSSLPDLIWDKYRQCFPSVWLASAFKGATGACTYATNIAFHRDNHVMWLGEIERLKGQFTNIRGIAFTGWQRYDHYAVLCELLPQALPSLAICMLTFAKGVFSSEVVDMVSLKLHFSAPLPFNPFQTASVCGCDFPGSDIYQYVLHLVCLEAHYNDFIHSERVRSWANAFNINKNHTNPLHLEPMLGLSNQLLASLRHLHTNLHLSLIDIYPEVSADEWLGTYLSPKIDHLQKFCVQVQQQISLWTNLAPHESGNTLEMDTSS